MSYLAQPNKRQLTKDSEIALSILKSKGVNPSKFIREAVEEKLYKDFRKTIKQIEDENSKEFCPF